MARSTAEFIAQIGIVVEEADETVFRLEIAEGCGLLPGAWPAPARREAEEGMAIFGASQRTARQK